MRSLVVTICVVVILVILAVLIASTPQERYTSNVVPSIQGSLLVPYWGEDDGGNLRIIGSETSNPTSVLVPDSILPTYRYMFQLFRAGGEVSILGKKDQDPSIYRVRGEHIMKPPTSYQTAGLNEFCLSNQDCKYVAPYCDTNINKCSTHPTF